MAFTEAFGASPPGGHSVQLALPGASLYVFAGHASHTP